MYRLFRALVYALLLSSNIYLTAQVSTATFLGTITDVTGASVPRATITITQTDTHAVRTVISKGNGSYRAEFLPIGPYSISVSSPSFRTLVRSGLTLSVGQEAQVDLTLEVGTAQETVEVTSEAPLLNTANATLGRTIDNVEIDNMPLVDRNPYALLDLIPGVQANNSITTTGNNGQGTSGTMINPQGFPEQHVKINGSTDGATGQISYYLDGGSNMTGLRNSGNSLPNPDALSQFRVDTNNFSAQFGRSSGGVVSALTKSGTNSFHGSVFEFYRSRNFNATQHLITVKTPYNQHRFGFTFGGPIKHNKLFFFGSYAGYRFVSSKNLLTYVPSAAMQRGDFSENYPLGAGAASTTAPPANACSQTASAASFYVCDPVTRKTPPRDPVTGKYNVVNPAIAFDPAIYAMIKAGLIPTPAPTALDTSPYARRDLSPFSQMTNEQLYKMDYQMTTKQRLTLSYFHQYGSNIFDASGNNILNYSKQNFTYNQHNANIQHVYVLNSNTVNQFVVSFSRLFGARINSPQESLAAYGSSYRQQLTSSTYCTGTGTGCARPQFAVQTWFTAGDASAGPAAGDNIYQVRDLLSTTHGRHTLTYGGEVAQERDFGNGTGNNYGVFTFQQANNTVGRSSASITDFFFGRPASMVQSVPTYGTATYWNVGLYLQDDWRALPNLTFNLGIRYDIQTGGPDSAGRMVGFIPGQQSTVIPSAPIGVLFRGDKGVSNGGAFTKYNHVSPRVGMVWDPYKNGKTIFRAGGGIFYGTVSGSLYTAASSSAPYGGTLTYTKVTSVANPYSNDPSEFPGGVSPFPYSFSASNPTFSLHPLPVTAFDPNFTWPAIYQFNVGWQQQLGKSFAVTASYVGALSRKIPMYQDINAPIYTPGAPSTAPAAGSAASLSGKNYPNTTTYIANRRPFNSSASLGGGPGLAGNPTYGAVYRIQSSESANYNGLQVTAEERLSKRLTVRGFYIWSRSMQSQPLDSTGSPAGTSQYYNPEDPYLKYLDRQRSDYDIRHMATISFVYQSNFQSSNFLLRQLADGWTVSGIIRVQSGMPFSVLTGNDDNQDGFQNDRPNLSGIGKPHLTDTGGSRTAAMKQWISPSYFCLFVPATNTCPGAGPGGIDGTVRANDFDAPGRRSVDASLFRDFAFEGNVRFQLRAEATNVFNLTNLPGPTANVKSLASFGSIPGTITGGSFGNRVLQIGGRVLF
ncbi:carboxypeptidase regulatory-like domain-containing protein [Edaphobacter flagellatus]|uniref:carboxypeptidase regulatory-like domain-containing protein n=1 Tax=Edaphobacter flagellatus TaxID=1933044 RepID=UPI0021B32540|nr:carboxypeptidase regulatory-like domain-containing protein [Edaphobacter flagellatus]